MKKTATILLACVLAMLCAAASASTLTLVDQVVYARRDYDTSSYGSIFAEVRNDGTEPVYMSELYDARFLYKDGSVLKEYANRGGFPTVLQPGETGYISEDMFLLAPYDEIGKGEITLHPSDKKTTMVSTRMPVTATLDLDELAAADGEDCYLYAELTNTTDELMGEFSISAAMWNQDNRIMFAYEGYVSALIPPGEKGVVRIELPGNLVEAWREKGDTPTYLECFSYVTRTPN